VAHLIGNDHAELAFDRHTAMDAATRSVTDMLRYALIFAVISLIAGFFGFSGLSAATAGIAKILFFIFVVIFLIFVVMALLGVQLFT
jgi:uncharacterized membrane protein YtjA (UPF0391 family)